jgi:hypothetical protein
MGDRRTRITIETERTLVVAHRQTARRWCRKCGREVELFTSDQAGRLLDVAPTEIEGREESKLRLGWAKDGLVVCLKSLLDLLLSDRSARRNRHPSAIEESKR